MYEFYPIYFIPYGKNIWFYRNWPPQKTSTIFLLLLVDFQYKNKTFWDKLFNLDLPETFLIVMRGPITNVNPIGSAVFVFFTKKQAKCSRKHKRGLKAKNKRFWLLLFLLLSVASIRRKWLIPKNACVHTKSDSCNNRKQITLIPKKSFRYYKQ